jgi:hypothetical protein
VEKVRELLQHVLVLETPEEKDVEEEREAVPLCSMGQHIVRPTVVHGNVITDRKSIFQGHTAIVTSTEEVS